MAIRTAHARIIKKHVFHFYSCGFTLIELLVVVAMLAVLFLGLVFAFNPGAQFDKAKDSQRQHDLGQIQRALDTYFNDTGCYPPSLPFGYGLRDTKNTVYMEKVPQDPDCNSSVSKCYVYEVPPGACPQWNILYAALKSKAIPNNACPLETLNAAISCVPVGYSTSGYNYCVFSGSLDCSVVANSTALSTGIGGGGGSGASTPTPIGGGGGGGGGGGSTPIPTPTPSGPLVCPNDQYYGCTGNSTCNSIAPKEKCQGYGGTVQCYCDVHCNLSCLFN